MWCTKTHLFNHLYPFSHFPGPLSLEGGELYGQLLYLINAWSIHGLVVYSEYMYKRARDSRIRTWTPTRSPFFRPMHTFQSVLASEAF